MACLPAVPRHARHCPIIMSSCFIGHAIKILLRARKAGMDLMVSGSDVQWKGGSLNTLAGPHTKTDHTLAVIKWGRSYLNVRSLA